MWTNSRAFPDALPRLGAPWLRAAVFAVSLALVAGCSSIVKFVVPEGSRLDWSGFTVVAEEGANLNTPVALDVVQVRDDAAVALVSTLPASKWFAARADLAKSFPEGLTIRSLEIPPGLTMKLKPDAFSASRQKAVFVFADYLTPGEHRARVDQLKGEILVQLGPRSFAVSNPK
jgi:type VI secretion system protein